MDIRIFDAQQLPIALAALRGTSRVTSARKEHYLSCIARLHGHPSHAYKRSTLGPSAAAAALTEPQLRKRVVQLAAVMATVDGSVDREEARAVADLARSMQVHEPAVATLQKLAAGRNVAARFDLMRRIFGRFMRDAANDHRLRDVLALTAGMLGGGDNPEVARRYARLQHYPEGSLGRALWDHCKNNGFSLPGERGAIPERVLFHDVGHLLSGYGTDPAGEIQQAAFQAGFVRHDGFAFLFFGIVQFHLGVKVTPIADAATGQFHIENVLLALARGASCKADLSDHWDFWAAAQKPLDALRAELGVPLPGWRSDVAA